MSQFKAIAAMDINGLIGDNGGLPWRCLEDLQHFKVLTTGHPVIMGRKTFDSLNRPNGLPNRLNLVLSAKTKMDNSNQVKWFTDIKQLFGYMSSAYVIGGAEIYKCFMPYISELHISKIPGEYTGDTWFPPISPKFKLQSREELKTFTYEVWAK